ncbi:hypothetical protein ACFL0M_11385 [Thermodesulfobacteriota bacterium]
MHGLTKEEWKDLVLSVNVHRKNRRLSPVQVATYISTALENTDLNTLASDLGFEDTTTIKRILRLKDIPDDLATIVDWGTRKGSISMSVATEIMRLSKDSLYKAIDAIVSNSMNKEEVRQLVQIQSRTDQSVDDCIQQVLKTRPRIERSELIIGSLLTGDAQELSNKLGNEGLAKHLRRSLAKRFPGIICQAVRINGKRFSLLFAEKAAQDFRNLLSGKTIESTVTELVEEIDKWQNR